MTDYEPAGEQLDAATEASLAALQFVDQKLSKLSTAAEERIVHDIAREELERANAAEELAEQAYAAHFLGLHDGAALGDALTKWGKWR